MLRLFVFLFCLFALGPLYSQRTVTFKTWGLPAFESEETKCVDSLQTKYGFRKHCVGGCVVTSGQVWRWKRHNARSERTMKRRHGKNWKFRYEAELRACRSGMQQ